MKQTWFLLLLIALKNLCLHSLSTPFVCPTAFDYTRLHSRYLRNPRSTHTIVMEKLNPKVQDFLKAIASAPPPDAVPGANPTKTASPEERQYWQKVNDGCMQIEMLSNSATINIGNTELFRYPSKDGQYEIESRFYRCKQTDGDKPPLIIHFHGGGMTLLNRDALYETKICALLRQSGVSVLSAEFRNAREHHFPDGVDDCVSTVQWAHAHQNLLGFDGTVVTAGCSGGGNLAIATFIRALEQGLPARELIDGIVADAPFIRPNYLGVDKLETIFSPCTGIKEMQDLVDNYTSSQKDFENPSAWPLLAATEILEQFPPTMLRGQEYDILHVDAEDFYDKLIDAGVEGCTLAVRKNMIHGQPYIGGFAGKIDEFTAIAEWAQFAKTMTLLKRHLLYE